MRKIILAGGTGHLGTLLKTAFLDLGWEVVLLSRQRNKKEDKVSYVFWDGEHLGNWTDVLEGADAVINLSGKSIQCRFTSKNKAILDDSRILPTKALGRAIARCSKPPRLWVNFSGISIFSGLNELQDETSIAVGTDYLAQLTRRWEAAFSAFDLSDTWKVILRVSPVLSKQQGMFAELLPIAKWGLGGKVAKGSQYVSWIHQQDFVMLVQWIIEQTNPRRVYHACTPHPVTNAAFMKVLRKSVGVSFGLPLPRIIAHIGSYIKGVDSSILLQSVPATTKYTVEDGFVFKFGNISDALADLV
ncbi:NAD-dependent epimerase/dehydratase family protein [Sphingobacterium phlebotomi]|uniref:NAD-dependent epimerase/dehydratase family protein n=1 Tax=Sphingobacterium phlebotomi TaxID=2605433 RepID=A0A5D4H1Q4_9SPHI|nr:NAD-dependent epimerase/dehydratase family protein [Sphingobacterium phlebotomi]TYR34487.1 NAD-dependent epimerase/dehydratase family protein [Sphingobacterium phlebotomi]